jgi:1-deoxyxylulose-5-phosphate synthase
VLTGRFLREFCRREEVVVASKVYYPVELGFKGGASAAAKPDRRPNMDGLSRKRIFHAVDDSLRRLGTDYIDLYQIHRLDQDTSMEEIMEALHDVVKSGKVRYIGASSMYAWQFAKMQQIAKERGFTRFASMQNHYNLAYREEEREMIPLCRDQGVALIPWSPLARGFLAGNRKQGDKEAGETSRAKTDDIAQNYYYRESDFKVVQALSDLGVRKGVSNATLAYAWLLHKSVTAPIVGASKTYQLDQAAAALDVQLAADEVAALEAPYEPHKILGHV